MSNEKNQIQKYESTATSLFSNQTEFNHGQRVAIMLAESDFLPAQYKDKPANCLVALELANRMNMNVLMVAQSLNMIKGRPSWDATFIISAINTSGRYSALEFEYDDQGMQKIEYTETVWQKGSKQTVKKTAEVQNLRCRAYAKSKATDKIIYGTWVSIELAVKEGWYFKDGSKWPNMPEQMLSYRAASFFGRLYCPEVLNGMHSVEEIRDSVEYSVDEMKGEPNSPDTVNAELFNDAEIIDEEPESEPEPEPEKEPKATDKKPGVADKKPEATDKKPDSPKKDKSKSDKPDGDNSKSEPDPDDDIIDGELFGDDEELFGD